MVEPVLAFIAASRLIFISLEFMVVLVLSGYLLVRALGLEPRTYGLKGRYSTN